MVGLLVTFDGRSGVADARARGWAFSLMIVSASRRGKRGEERQQSENDHADLHEQIHGQKI